jgi:hypothetical protein
VLSLSDAKWQISSLAETDSRFPLFLLSCVASQHQTAQGDPDLIFLTDGASPGVQAWYEKEEEDLFCFSDCFLGFGV